MTDRATGTTGDPARHDPDGPTGSREGRLAGGGGGAERDLARDPDGGRADVRPDDAPAAGRGAPVGGRSPDARDGMDPGGGDRAAGSGDREGDATLVDPERARGYQDRWMSLKGDFVDEPRRAVRDANALVGEVLDDVEATFRRQRERLERDMDDHDASTEDLRLALNRYRSFFDRLLTL